MESARYISPLCPELLPRAHKPFVSALSATVWGRGLGRGGRRSGRIARQREASQACQTKSQDARGGNFLTLVHQISVGEAEPF